jgi:hypothetical protein
LSTTGLALEPAEILVDTVTYFVSRPSEVKIFGTALAAGRRGSHQFKRPRMATTASTRIAPHERGVESRLLDVKVLARAGRAGGRRCRGLTGGFT